MHTNTGKLLLAAILLQSGAACAASQHLAGRSQYLAPFAETAPIVDGESSDAAWQKASWRAIDNRWLGPEYSEDDFSGRFKVLWTREKLYLMVEFSDDILIDTHRDPLVQYWDDDCLEIFIDEDHSGGNHQYNHNAFAYHLSLDNKAIDIDTSRLARDYSDHVQSRWQQHSGEIVWEVAIDVYSDEFVDGSSNNKPVELYAGKILGLMLAYCDNDGSELRENFIGSEQVASGPTDRGWIDAGIFGTLILEEK